MSQIKIRVADPERDAEALCAIYAPYVLETAISFEYEVPSVAEFARRMTATLERYPYIVAETDGAAAGYAYAHPFVEREAYSRSAEMTIYVEQGLRRSGLGRALYTAIEKALALQNVTNLNSCIGVPRCENDPHLTLDSVRFHTRLGYRMVGRFDGCGYKFGRWYDMAWMEKIIAPHGDNPAPMLPFPEIREQFEQLLAKGE